MIGVTDEHRMVAAERDETFGDAGAADAVVAANDDMSIAAAAVGEADAAVAWLLSNFRNGMIKPPFNVRTETADNNTAISSRPRAVSSRTLYSV